jgi:hypothetical protein
VVRDKFLFDRGSETLNQKKWIVSREYFRQLVDGYPQSRYRADAKLGVGDTYLGEGSAESYVLAANEFREFLTPTRAAAGRSRSTGWPHAFTDARPSAIRRRPDALRELQRFLDGYPTAKPGRRWRGAPGGALDCRSEFRVGLLYHRLRVSGAISGSRASASIPPTRSGTRSTTTWRNA